MSLAGEEGHRKLAAFIDRRRVDGSNGGIYELTYYTKLYPAAICVQMAHEVCPHRRSRLDSI